MLGQQADLCRFAAAVRAFEGNEAFQSRKILTRRRGSRP